MYNSEREQTDQIFKQQENVALQELKNRLGILEGLSRKAGPRSGKFLDIRDSIWNSAIDEFLLRFLRSKNLVVSEAIKKLGYRRSFEQNLLSINITPTTTSILRSGAINVLGRDFEGCQVLLLNLDDLRIPILDPSEAQRLSIILLEYMQSLCMIINPLGLDVAATASKAISIDNVHQLCIDKNLEDLPLPRRQKLTLLVNKSVASWETYTSALRKITALFTIIDKYYPYFVNRVLVHESDLLARESFDANLKQWLKDMNYMIHVVDTDALKTFLPEQIIPESLGGMKLHTNSPVSFSEAVLRHWDALTSAIRQRSKTIHSDCSTSGNPIEVTEYSGISSWPLYLSPLLAMSFGHFQAVKCSSEVYAESCKTNSPIDLRQINAASRLKDSSISTESSLEVASTLYSIGEGHSAHSMHPPTNDSIYSVNENNNRNECNLNDSHEIKDGPDKDVRPSQFIDPSKLELIRDDPLYVLPARTPEHGRCLTAEQQLCGALFSLHHDPHPSTFIERRLVDLHQEVDVLVSDLLSRAKVTSNGKELPSLVQLLDYTLTALETVVDVPEEVPIVSLMQPRQRESGISRCCLMM
ncbi:unnamed protein product [Phytomonas sp. Hart1]|nr:unnamed protein product [Phytomonas sp. Hart1]|eukprot:CCW66306.1 unnamed protein product [Phytomonas sp. isolate Hart1]